MDKMRSVSLRAKVAEYATDIDVIMKRVILAASMNYRINPVFERLIIDRTR